jgi:hypothetical protein
MGHLAMYWPVLGNNTSVVAARTLGPTAEASSGLRVIFVPANIRLHATKSPVLSRCNTLEVGQVKLMKVNEGALQVA